MKEVTKYYIIDFINLAVTYLDFLSYTWAESSELVAVQCCAMLAIRLSIQPIFLSPWWPAHA